MKITGGGLALVLGLTVSLGVSPAEAQRRPGVRGAMAGPFAGQSLDVLLENQEALELKADQVTQLNELKDVLDRDVKPLAEEMRTLREQIRGGEIDAPVGFRQMEVVRGRLITASAPLRGRIQEILTVQQHRQLQRLVRVNRPGLGRARVGPGAFGGGWGRPSAGWGGDRAFRRPAGRPFIGRGGFRGGFGPGQGDAGGQGS